MPEEVPRPAVEDPIGKRKRDAEEIVEKQKMVNETCDDGVAHPAVDKLKFVAMKLEKREAFKESKPSSSKQSVVPTAKKPDDEVDTKTKKFFVPKDFVPVYIFPPPEGGTKLVFMDNLHPDIKESDVIEFFKDAGKIDRITFFGTKSGCGDVRFETPEAALKALKRNGELFFDRPVTLLESEERTIFDFITPSIEEKYLFMGNLSLSVVKEDIVEFFKDYGKIVSLRLMNEDHPFKGAKLVAHVEFTSSAEAFKAYRLYGQMLHGRRVEFSLATEKNVWYSFTPSSSKPPPGPGWGSLSGPCCSSCKKNLGI